METEDVLKAEHKSLVTELKRNREENQRIVDAIRANEKKLLQVKNNQFIQDACGHGEGA